MAEGLRQIKCLRHEMDSRAGFILKSACQPVREGTASPEGVSHLIPGCPCGQLTIAISRFLP